MYSVSEPFVQNFTKILPQGSCCGNNLGDEAFDQFWQNQQNEEIMDYQINHVRQIVIDADNPEEAIRKAMNGEGQVIATNFSASQRPQMPQAARAAMPATPAK